VNDGSARLPIILFGAFDRHNFGDLLFPHVAAALIPTLMPGRELVFAGLAERDLRCFGGHAVQALARLGLDRAEHPHWLVHVGGEILTCSAWQAAVMLLPPEQVQPTIAYLGARPQERLAFVQRLLGTAAVAPYTVRRRGFAGPFLLLGVLSAGFGTVRGLVRLRWGFRSRLVFGRFVHWLRRCWRSHRYRQREPLPLGRIRQGGLVDFASEFGLVPLT